MISIRTILFILVRLTNSYVKAIKISNNYSIVKEVNFQIVSGEIGTKLILKKKCLLSGQRPYEREVCHRCKWEVDRTRDFTFVKT